MKQPEVPFFGIEVGLIYKKYFNNCIETALESVFL